MKSYDSYNKDDQNFYNSFKPNNTLVNMRNFNNKNDILYNNLEPNILNQDVHEVNIQIDSTDRDYKVYPNPFDMKIIFNPIADTFDKKTNTLFKGTSKPTIPIDFSNVKYIKLEYAILPRNYILKKKYTENTNNVLENVDWVYDNKKLSNERFILVDIDELYTDNSYGTNDEITRSFGTLYCDKILNEKFFYTSTYSCLKIFPSSQLGDIKSFTIRLKNSCGSKLNINNLDLTCDTPKECICDSSKFTDEQKQKCVCSYKRHPLNPDLQVFLSFKIGYLRNELNINPLKN
jgi:hypothetical protein